MSFLVKELFITLQGEGHWAGTPAVFVRFAGCNLWSGFEKDRARDAERNGAQCPRFCDTDFVGGQRLEARELAREIASLASSTNLAGDSITLVVFTGGEPLLQLNKHPELIKELRTIKDGWEPFLALETNGTIDLNPDLISQIEDIQIIDGLDWICVSPKMPVSKLVLTRGHELKVVYPAYDPLEYLELEDNFDELSIQPEAPPSPGSLVSRDALARAVQFCLTNPRWRLSLQTHKILDIR